MSFKEIFNKLGFKNANIVKKENSNFKLMDYDYILKIHNTPLIMFKEFNKSNQKEINKLSKRFWNYGRIPILFIKIKNEYIIYNSKLHYKNVWMRLDDDTIDEFNYFNLVSGEFFKKYENDFKGSSIADLLLNSFKELHTKLTKKGLTTDEIFNTLIILLFAKILIDKKILKQKIFYKLYNKSFEDIIAKKDDLNSFINYLNSRFGGDLFTPLCNISNSQLRGFHDFFKANRLIFKQNFKDFDFSAIPVELVCSLYENFNETMGIYYTPKCG